MDFAYNTEVAMEALASRIAELEKENAVLKAGILQYQQGNQPVPGENPLPDNRPPENEDRQPLEN